MPKVVHSLAIVVAFVATASFCQSPATPSQQEPVSSPASSAAPAAPLAPLAADAQSSRWALRLGAGDLVDVEVFGIPEMKTTARVASSGEMTLPLLGNVHVAGLTPEEARTTITRGYQDGGFLRDPHISITIKEYATQGVSVVGEVNKPGVYPVLGPRRLFDIISAAQGLSKTAGREITISRRDRPQDPIHVPLGRDMSQSFESNVEVYPGDTVVVARAGIVYVTGDVGKPGGFVLDNADNLTVLQALALAGGANKTAKLGNSKVFRFTPSGVREEVPINLSKILSSKTADLQLNNNDILFVPSSAAKGAARRAAEAAIQTAVGVAIYHP